MLQTQRTTSDSDVTAAKNVVCLYRFVDSSARLSVRAITNNCLASVDIADLAMYRPRWRSGATVTTLNLRSTGRGFKSYSGQKLRSNLGQVVHIYVPLSPSSITWYRPRGGDALRPGR